MVGETSDLMYPALFESFQLVSGDALKGKKQHVGFLKARIRIVDHSPPTITASEDSSSSGNALLGVEGSHDDNMPGRPKPSPDPSIAGMFY